MRATCLFCGSLESFVPSCPRCGEKVYDGDDPADRELIEAARGLATQAALRGDRALQVWLAMILLACLTLGPLVFLMPAVLVPSVAVTAVLCWRALRRKPAVAVTTAA